MMQIQAAVAWLISGCCCPGEETPGQSHVWLHVIETEFLALRGWLAAGVLAALQPPKLRRAVRCAGCLSPCACALSLSSSCRASTNPRQPPSFGLAARPRLESSAHRLNCAACSPDRRNRFIPVRQNGRVRAEPQVCALHWHGTSMPVAAATVGRRRGRRKLLLTRLPCRAALRRPWSLAVRTTPSSLPRSLLSDLPRRPRQLANEASRSAGMGAAYGTAKSGIGIAGVGIFRPDLIMKVGGLLVWQSTARGLV
jgi:hypothetical protein